MPLRADSTRRDASFAAQKQESATNAKLVILVVEDDAPVRGVIEAVLRTFNFTVITAASGKRAVELYRRNAVDLVLLDVQMPVMDGPATLAALQEVNPKVVCCFLSGHTGKYTSDELLRMGAASVLAKPFKLPILRQEILDAVKGRR
jgi:CheY-like chemotaxis protein